MSWHPGRIGDSVRREVARLGPRAALGPLVEAWPAAVGPAIAENAWPARLARDGTLVVSTSSSVWAFELTALESTVVEHLRAALGDAAPAKIRFAPGRLPERGPAGGEAAAPSPPAVSEAHRRAAADLAAGIESEALREAVARAAAVSLARSDDPPDDRAL